MQVPEGQTFLPVLYVMRSESRTAPSTEKVLTCLLSMQMETKKV